MGATVLLAQDGWCAHGATFARGQAYDSQGRLLRGVALAQRFAGLASIEEWAALAASLNGSFAAVSSAPHGALAAVDRLRSIPLFHTQERGLVAIAASASPLLDRLPARAGRRPAARRYRCSDTLGAEHAYGT